MARPRKDVTETCPTCGGAMVVPGARYTEPEVPCPTCGDDGSVPEGEGEKLAAAGVEEQAEPDAVEEPTQEPDAA